MLKAAIIIAGLVILIAAFLTDSRLAPPVGAALLFFALMYGWFANRQGGPDNIRKAEEATHRQREKRAGKRR